MVDDPGFIWERKPLGNPPRRRTSAPRQDVQAPARAVEFGGRITLREAESRFGVPVQKLRVWARTEMVNGVMGAGPNGGRMWLVTPESVAHQLSRTAPVPDQGAVAKTGPTPDGAAMLVPRDAWDRLMDQLGNLHDAGVQLAEARERAARAETEASFLRERLAELRSERDDLKQRTAAAPPRAAPATHAAPPGQTMTDRLREAYHRLLGK